MGLIKGIIPMVFLPFSLWLFDSSTFTKWAPYTPWNFKRLVETHTLGKKAFQNKRNNMIEMRYLQQKPTWKKNKLGRIISRETIPRTSFFCIGDILGSSWVFFKTKDIYPSWWLNQPTWKICSSKWINHFPRIRDEHKKYLKPPPRIQ